MFNRKIIATRSVLASVLFLLLIQAIPYGRNHTNPLTIREPSWNNGACRAVAKRACFDCHSYETVWPWYSHFAPMSWMVQYDVDKGREKLNFSDWQGGARKGERPAKIREEIDEGEMPPFLFRLAHPESRMSATDKKLIIDCLTYSAHR